jgi:hypothetical protein
MKRSTLARVVGIGAAAAVVLVGCGGDGSSSSTSFVTISTPSTAVDPCTVTPAEPLPLVVTWNAEPALREGGTTTWNITVRNTSTGPLAVPFATSQVADMTMRQNGTVVYQYSEDRTFQQVEECRRLPVGASFTIRLPEERPFTAAPGTYNLEVEVLVAGQPIVVRDFVAVGQGEDN